MEEYRTALQRIRSISLENAARDELDERSAQRFLLQDLKMELTGEEGRAVARTGLNCC